MNRSKFDRKLKISGFKLLNLLIEVNNVEPPISVNRHPVSTSCGRDGIEREDSRVYGLRVHVTDQLNSCIVAELVMCPLNLDLFALNNGLRLTCYSRVCLVFRHFHIFLFWTCGKIPVLAVIMTSVSMVFRSQRLVIMVMPIWHKPRISTQTQNLKLPLSGSSCPQSSLGLVVLPYLIVRVMSQPERFHDHLGFRIKSSNLNDLKGCLFPPSDTTHRSVSWNNAPTAAAVLDLRRNGCNNKRAVKLRERSRLGKV